MRGEAVGSLRDASKVLSVRADFWRGSAPLVSYGRQRDRKASFALTHPVQTPAYGKNFLGALFEKTRTRIPQRMIELALRAGLPYSIQNGAALRRSGLLQC